MVSLATQTPSRTASTFDVLAPTVGIAYAWLLVKLGYPTLSELKSLSMKDLETLPGIGAVRAKLIMKAIIQFGDASINIGSSSDDEGRVVYVNFRQLDLFD